MRGVRRLQVGRETCTSESTTAPARLRRSPQDRRRPPRLLARARFDVRMGSVITKQLCLPPTSTQSPADARLRIERATGQTRQAERFIAPLSGWASATYRTAKNAPPPLTAGSALQPSRRHSLSAQTPDARPSEPTGRDTPRAPSPPVAAGVVVGGVVSVGTVTVTVGCSSGVVSVPVGVVSSRRRSRSAHSRSSSCATCRPRARSRCRPCRCDCPASSSAAVSAAAPISSPRTVVRSRPRPRSAGAGCGRRLAVHADGPERRGVRIGMGAAEPVPPRPRRARSAGRSEVIARAMRSVGRCSSSLTRATIRGVTAAAIQVPAIQS